MSRPKAECGEYAAYRRHLRDRTAVCSPCRAAQQAHDRERSSSFVDRDHEVLQIRPAVMTPRERQVAQERTIRATVVKVLEAIDADHWGEVMGLSATLDDLFDEHCDLDDVVWWAENTCDWPQKEELAG